MTVAAGDSSAAAAVGRAVHGKVVDEQGAPIRGCEVHLGEASTLTDAQGEFRFDYPPRKHRLPLRLATPGFAERRLLLPRLPARPDFDLGVFELSRGVSVGGTVLGPDRRPQPGARVFLTTEAGISGTRSDERGGFVFERVDPGRYDLLIGAEGLAIGSWPGIRIGPGGTRSLGDLVLESGAELAGRLEWTHGGPVAGVPIRVRYSSAEPHDLGRLEGGLERSARTDASGGFRLSGLMPGATVYLAIDGPGLLTPGARRQQIPTGARSVVEVGVLKVEPTAPITGRLLDPAGVPIEGARLHPSRVGQPQGHSGRRSEKTGADGRFRLERLPIASYRLEIFANGFEALTVAARPGGPPLELVGRPVPSGRLRVTVSSESSEAAEAAEAELQLQGLGGDAEYVNQSVRLGHPGREDWNSVTWPRLPTGSYELTLVGENHARLAKRTAQLAEGSNEVEIDLPPRRSASSASGRLVRGNGEPVPFAWIALERRDVRWASYSTRSDGHGNWHVELEPGIYDVNLDAPGLLGRRVEGVKIESGANPQGSWELSRGRVLRGRLNGLSPHELSRLNFSASSEEASAWTEVDFDGRYRVIGLTEGRWSLSGEVSGSPLRAEAEVVVQEGATLPLLELTFRAALSLRGHVADNGAPLANAHVWAEPWDDSLYQGASAGTDAAGNFELTGLAPGRYGLRISVPGVGRIHGREVRVPDDDGLEIRLATAWASGRVVRADDGSPLPDTHVRFDPIDHDRPDENGLVHVVTHQYFGGIDTDAGGAFRVGPLEEGLWRLRVDLEGFVPIEHDITIADGVDVAGVEIAVAPTPGLRLEVVTESGARPESVKASLQDAAGHEVAMTFFMPRSGDELFWSQAPPGEWSLVITDEQVGACSRQQVSVPGPRVRVVLPSLGALHLNVAELAGDAAEAKLELLDAEGGLFARRTLTRSGRGYLTRIPPGMYEVRVEAEDGRSWGKWIAIDGDRVTRASLD